MTTSNNKISPASHLLSPSPPRKLPPGLITNSKPSSRDACWYGNLMELIPSIQRSLDGLLIHPSKATRPGVAFLLKLKNRGSHGGVAGHYPNQTALTRQDERSGNMKAMFTLDRGKSKVKNLQESSSRSHWLVKKSSFLTLCSKHLWILSCLYHWIQEASLADNEMLREYGRKTVDVLEFLKKMDLLTVPVPGPWKGAEE